MHKILAENFFSPEKPGRVQPGGEDEQCIMTLYIKKKKLFFLGCLGIIMHLSNLVLLGQLLFYDIIFYLIPIMLS